MKNIWNLIANLIQANVFVRISTSVLKEHITAPLMNIVKILSEDFDVGHYQVPDHVTEQEKQVLNVVANLTGMGKNTQSILRKPDAKFLMDFVFSRIHATVV